MNKVPDNRARCRISEASYHKAPNLKMAFPPKGPSHPFLLVFSCDLANKKVAAELKEKEMKVC